MCASERGNIFLCHPNKNRRFSTENEYKGPSSIKKLLKWCYKKTPDSNQFDEETARNAKEHLQKDAFDSKLNNLSRIETIYKKSDQNLDVAQNISSQRAFDKRFRLLEAKIDHLSRFE